MYALPLLHVLISITMINSRELRQDPWCTPTLISNVPVLSMLHLIEVLASSILHTVISQIIPFFCNSLCPQTPVNNIKLPQYMGMMTKCLQIKCPHTRRRRTELWWIKEKLCFFKWKLDTCNEQGSYGPWKVLEIQWSLKSPWILKVLEKVLEFLRCSKYFMPYLNKIIWSLQRFCEVYRLRVWHPCIISVG